MPVTESLYHINYFVNKNCTLRKPKAQKTFTEIVNFAFSRNVSR